MPPRTPTRVAIASRVYAPEPAAAAFRLRATASALARRGADVTVLTSRTSAAGLAGERGVRVRRWPVLRAKDGTVRGYLPYASFDAPLLGRLLLGRRNDTVLVEPPPTTGTVARLALTIRRTPYVYYAADLVSAAAEGAGFPAPVVALTRALEAFAVRRAAAVVTVNDELRRHVERLGAAPSRVHVVGNGVDTGVFTLDGPVRDVAPGRSGPLFVYPGTMNDLHGAEVFVEGFRRALPDLPEATLVMVGRGSEVERVAAAGATLEPGSFVGLDAMPGTDVAAIVRGATAALASVRPGGGYTIALATKAVAAAATGTPVVFAGEGPTVDVVTEGGLGHAVPWDADAVADALRTVARGSDGDAGRRAERAAWVQANASLDAVGERVAEIVLAARR
ncbi:glycosyltransferase [Cellulosimicrobium funkei]|uniref:glycosyltransferase n=1 Tax=Cellulosimicrobium funkei TaxID=264251 RepID=UPI0036F7920A